MYQIPKKQLAVKLSDFERNQLQEVSDQLQERLETTFSNGNHVVFGVLQELKSLENKVKSLAGVGSVPNISQSNLNEIEIEVPSLSIQQSIVEKLDAFESLISSLKEEIALRQKQYEYYREKLLTFN